MQDDLETRLAKIKLDENENEEKIKEKCSELEEELENRKTELNNIFAKVDDKRRVSFDFPNSRKNNPYSNIYLYRNARYLTTCVAKSALKFCRNPLSLRLASRTNERTLRSICKESATLIPSLGSNCNKIS